MVTPTKTRSLVLFAGSSLAAILAALLAFATPGRAEAQARNLISEHWELNGRFLQRSDAASGRGGSWDRNGVIIFTPAVSQSIYRVPAAGGTATAVTTVDRASGENTHRTPWFLPDGHHFFYTARNDDAEKNAVYVADLDSKERKRIRSKDACMLLIETGETPSSCRNVWNVRDNCGPARESRMSTKPPSQFVFRNLGSPKTRFYNFFSQVP